MLLQLSLFLPCDLCFPHSWFCFYFVFSSSAFSFTFSECFLRLHSVHLMIFSLYFWELHLSNGFRIHHVYLTASGLLQTSVSLVLGRCRDALLPFHSLSAFMFSHFYYAYHISNRKRTECCEIITLDDVLRV